MPGKIYIGIGVVLLGGALVAYYGRSAHRKEHKDVQTSVEAVKAIRANDPISLRVAALEGKALAAFAMPAGRDRVHALADAILEWASYSPDEAMRFVVSLPGSESYRTTVSRKVMLKWLARDAAAAEAYALETIRRNPAHAELFVEAIGQHYSAAPDGPRAFGIFLSQMPPDVVAFRAVLSPVAAMMRKGLPGANLLYDLFPRELASMVGRARAHHQARAMGTAYLDSRLTEDLNSTSVQGELVSGLKAYYPKDPDATVAWLARAPGVPFLDAERLSLVDVETWRNPKRALHIALSVGNESLRTQYVQSTYAVWFKLEPAAARSWAAEQEHVPAAVLEKAIDGTIPLAPRINRYI